MIEYVFIAEMKQRLLKGLIKSDYGKSKINILVIIICSAILRNIIDLFMYQLTRSGHETIDFFLSVIITVLLALNSLYIEKMVKMYEDYLLVFTGHLIDNYSEERYRFWRKICVTLVSSILLVYFFFVEVSSYWIMCGIIHFLICCYIIDKVEDWHCDKSWPGRIKKWLKHKNQKIVVKQITPLTNDMFLPYSSETGPEKGFKLQSSTRMSMIPSINPKKEKTKYKSTNIDRQSIIHNNKTQRNMQDTRLTRSEYFPMGKRDIDTKNLQIIQDYKGSK